MALNKKLNSNHLGITGTEGIVGCQDSEELFEVIYIDPNTDSVFSA
jgi:hypothetical protein